MKTEKKIRQTKKGRKITDQIDRGFEIASKWKSEESLRKLINSKKESILYCGKLH